MVSCMCGEPAAECMAQSVMTSRAVSRWLGGRADRGSAWSRSSRPISSPCSYGFRPNRRADDAVAEVRHFTSRAYEWVVEDRDHAPPRGFQGE